LTITVSPEEYLKQAEIIYDEVAVSEAILSIANQLNQFYAVEKPVILSVMNGAAYFTGQLLPKLKFPLELDYIQATRYRGDLQGKDLSWIVRPKETIKNRSVLILDDILDEGFTLKAIIEECNLLGAKEVKSTVLVEKKLNISKPIQADFVGLLVPNQYVFGCGMDVHGWWRNLPEIYALITT
jgi:hypoxanthine phosphoribosyltransferase